MGEQERPGEQEAMRSGRITEDDTEGHRRVWTRAGEGTDQPPTGDDETEGHAKIGRATSGDEDTEGDRRYSRATEGDEPPSDGGDTDGHAVRPRG
jgi:hypothetical protein